MRSPLLSAICLAAILGSAGCHRDESAKGAPVQPPGAEGSALQPAGAPSVAGEAFGMAKPASAVVVRRADGAEHVSTPEPVSSVVATLKRSMPGFDVTEYAYGARFEAKDGSGRSAFVYREAGSPETSVSYYGPSAGASSPGRSAEPAAGLAAGGGSRPAGASPGGADAAPRSGGSQPAATGDGAVASRGPGDAAGRRRGIVGAPRADQWDPSREDLERRMGPPSSATSLFRGVGAALAPVPATDAQGRPLGFDRTPYGRPIRPGSLATGVQAVQPTNPSAMF
jgi:hypothetical protein